MCFLLVRHFALIPLLQWTYSDSVAEPGPRWLEGQKYNRVSLFLLFLCFLYYRASVRARGTDRNIMTFKFVKIFTNTCQSFVVKGWAPKSYFICKLFHYLFEEFWYKEELFLHMILVWGILVKRGVGVCA